MDSGLLSLKWENHRNTFFEVLYKIRKNGNYCDTTIACDGKFYKVNKLVLSTCSEYLHQMLEEANIGSAYIAHPIIVLKDIRHQHLEALLDYMYIGEVNVLQSELSSLIKAAEYLQIKGLAVPDDPKSKYEKRGIQELETVNKNDFLKRTKIGGTGEQSKVNTVESPREENKNVNSNLINEDCNSDIFHQSNYNSDELENNENIDSDIHRKKYYVTSSENHSSPDRYNENEKDNHNTIDSTYYENNQGTLLIKEEQLDNSSHLYMDENNYGKEYSHTNYAPANPQTSKNEDIFKEIPSESIQLTLEDSSNDSGHLGSQEIGINNKVNCPEKSLINSMEEQNFHKQFNILNNGAELWPHSSPTTAQGVSCPYCLKLYYRKDAFLYHYKTHIGKKPYSCPYCNQSFIQKGSLKNHIKTHTGEKPFECPHCHRRFVQKTHMDNHVKTHTGEKPFPCPMCPKRFIQKVHMENHILTHTGEKPLSCPYCSYRFSRKDTLKDHISRRHPGHNL
ncbi:unnamed protein product [Meganyctiphanes norvegica]|uniref:Uncharacterized protein n=1 Tax=Meganyctiphanes norvegica TaxID=48144 RepID=A0AAV2RYK3_MEGNR